MRRLTNKEFIEKSNLKHEDLFDYSLSEYVNDGIKVKIICKTHGIFEQRPNSYIYIKRKNYFFFLYIYKK